MFAGGKLFNVKRIRKQPYSGTTKPERAARTSLVRSGSELLAASFRRR